MTTFIEHALPLLIPTVGGILLLLFGLRAPRKLNEVLTTLFVVLFASALFFTFRDLNLGVTFSDTPFPAMIEFDRFTLFGFIIVFAAGILGVVSSHNYFFRRRVPWGEFLALTSFLSFGAALMIASKNIITLYIGLETLSLAAYVLAGFGRDEPLSKEASIKYFVMGSVASAIFLFGAAFYYGATGSLDLSSFRFAVTNQSLLQIAISLLVSGIAFKAAIFPFQWWAPDVYQGAPLPVAGIFATTVKAAALLTAVHLVSQLGAQTNLSIAPLIALLAVVTMTCGNLLAIVQDNVKRMLAYSSIAHAGYILSAFVVLSTNAALIEPAILFYIATYVVMTAGAFAVLTLISEKTSTTSDKGENSQLAHFAGLGRSMPFIAISFAIFLVSLAGLPPTGGFFAKFYLFNALVKSGYGWLAVAGLSNSFISLFFYMKPVISMFFSHEAPAENKNTETEVALYSIITITTLIVIAAGVVPSLFLSFLNK